MVYRAILVFLGGEKIIIHILLFRVMGRTYPPEDVWKEPDLSSKANHASSASKKKGPKKADSARRLKVI